MFKEQMRLFATLVEIHTITSCLLILDHLEILGRQSKGFQDTISKL